MLALSRDALTIVVVRHTVAPFLGRKQSHISACTDRITLVTDLFGGSSLVLFASGFSFALCVGWRALARHTVERQEARLEVPSPLHGSGTGLRSSFRAQPVRDFCMFGSDHISARSVSGLQRPSSWGGRTIGHHRVQRHLQASQRQHVPNACLGGGPGASRLLGAPLLAPGACQ